MAQNGFTQGIHFKERRWYQIRRRNVMWPDPFPLGDKNAGGNGSGHSRMISILQEDSLCGDCPTTWQPSEYIFTPTHFSRLYKDRGPDVVVAEKMTASDRWKFEVFRQSTVNTSDLMEKLWGHTSATAMSETLSFWECITGTECDQVLTTLTHVRTALTRWIHGFWQPPTNS